MAIAIEYPLYLVPVPGGYASVVQKDSEDQQTHLLAVFLEEEAATRFMMVCRLLGAPKPLGNAREFRWLLQSLKNPVTRVAFDPSPDSPEIVAKWIVSIDELLQTQLETDQSPWNYPVYVIAQEDGFACIEGAASDGQLTKAIGLFTSKNNVDSYLEAAEESGTAMELVDMQQTRHFLSALEDTTPVVALNPIVEDGRRQAKYCFLIEMLLDKYLIQSNERSNEDAD